MKITEPENMLVARALEGDGQAFGDLVADHLDTLRRFLHARVREDSVEDLVQETLIRAHIGLADLKDRSRFGSWMIGIAGNLVRMSYRDRGTRTSVLDEYEMSTAFDIQVSARTFSPEIDLLESERTSAVQRAIKRLPEETRSMVRLHYEEGLSYKEIAKRLDVRVPTVEGRLYRARLKLKEDLKMTQTTTDMFDLQDKLTALQEQVDELQEQQRRITKEDEMAMGQERSAAASQILRLPPGEDEPITWGIVGAFRTDSRNSKRTAIRTTSIDNYLGQLSNDQIASFARTFSEPRTIEVLKQLVRGPLKEGDLQIDGMKKKDVGELLAVLETDRILVREKGKINVSHQDLIVGLMSLVSLAQMFHMNVTGEIDAEDMREQGNSGEGRVRTRSRKRDGESMQEMEAK